MNNQMDKIQKGAEELDGHLREMIRWHFSPEIPGKRFRGWQT